MRDKDARALGGHVDVFRRCKTQGSKATLKDAETAKLSSEKNMGNTSTNRHMTNETST